MSAWAAIEYWGARNMTSPVPPHRNPRPIFISDSSLREDFRKGLSGLENLTEDVSAQFGLFTLNFIKIAENLHFQYVNGALDRNIWTAWEYHLSKFLTTVGCQQFYEPRRQSFNPNFRDWMDNQVPDTQVNPFDFSGPTSESVSE